MLVLSCVTKCVKVYIYIYVYVCICSGEQVTECLEGCNTLKFHNVELFRLCRQYAVDHFDDLNEDEVYAFVACMKQLSMPVTVLKPQLVKRYGQNFVDRITEPRTSGAGGPSLSQLPLDFIKDKFSNKF